MTGWRPDLPEFAVSLWLGPALLIAVTAVGTACGWLRSVRKWRAGDTRKIFHFAVFAAAGVLLAWRGAAAVNLLGGVTALYVGFALWQGENRPAYEALARPEDHPRRSLHVIVPFVSTAVGGIAAVDLFGSYAAVGFAVTGCGDAVAEPVGIRFGRHRYRVPSLGTRTERSLEGSAAVLVVSAIASFAALSLDVVAGELSVADRCWAAAAVAVTAVVIEAITVHGFDNLTLQVGASWVAWGASGGV